MTKELILPEFGEDIKEVSVSYWHFNEGDRIEQGQDVVEVSTDKAAISIPSPCTGILKSKNYQEGDAAKIGSVVAIIEEDLTNAKCEM